MRGLAAVLAVIGLAFPAAAQQQPEARTCGWSATTTCRPAAPISRSSTSRATAGSPTSATTAARSLNPLTGKQEDNGTSIVDVTDPKQPKYLAHIPGEPGGRAKPGGAQMVARLRRQRSCRARDKSKVYLLRSFGSSAHEIWDVTDPAKPTRVTVVVSGLRDTHKSWWECDTGIAYLVSGVPDWRTRRMTQIYDLSDPAQAGVHPQLRPAGPAAGLDRAGADRPARADLDRPEGQPRLLRLRHRRERHRADRRPREAAERTEGADRRETCVIRRSAASICRPTSARTRRSRCSACSAEFAGDSPNDAAAGGSTHATSSIDQGDATRSRETRCQRMPRTGRWCGSSTSPTETEAVRRLVLDGARSRAATSASAAGASARTPRTRTSRRSTTSACCSSRTSTPACARVDVRDPLNPKEIGYLHPGRHRQDRQALRRRRARTSAARSRSRPTTSRSTTAATSTSSTAPTPGMHILELTGAARQVAGLQ